MNFINLYKVPRLNQIIHSILFRFLGEPNWRYFLIHDLRALLWFDMEWKSDAYQWIRDRMGSRRFCDGEYQLYKILMAARHSNSQFEAISKTSNCHRRRWFDNFQEQKSVVYHLNRSHHFLPDEIQRLSIGPSSKNLILDTLWFHRIIKGITITCMSSLWTVFIWVIWIKWSPLGHYLVHSHSASFFTLVRSHAFIRTKAWFQRQWAYFDIKAMGQFETCCLRGCHKPSRLESL